MNPAANGKIWQTMVLATVLALAVALPAAASIPPLETRPPLDALAAQAVAAPPAPAPADAPFRLYTPGENPLAGPTPTHLHLLPEAKTRVRGIDLEIVPRIELRRFQVPERTGFALFGGEESRRRARILYYAKARYYDPTLGLFLTEDPFAGEVNNPPSLHRYLYAYQNPTVWVDPTGEIAVLQALKDKIAEGKEAILDLADRLDDNRAEQNVLQRQVAEELTEKAGIAAGLAGIAESLVGLANFGVNAALVDQSIKGREFGDLSRQAEEEMLATVAQAEQVIAVVKEDPVGVGAELVRSARGTVVAAAQGDSRAKAEVIAFATEVVVDIAIGGKGVGQVAKGGRRVADAVVETVDIAGEFVVRRGGQAGRSGRALFEELPAGGRAGDDLGNALRGEMSGPTGATGTRAQALLEGAPGVNVTARADALQFRKIISGGRPGAGTPLTDLQAIEGVIGRIPAGNRMAVSRAQAAALEEALGLPSGRLGKGGVISIVDDVTLRAPRSPLSGNELFLGGGRGLPGGGPEINVAPISTAGGGGVRQVILDVR